MPCLSVLVLNPALLSSILLRPGQPGMLIHAGSEASEPVSQVASESECDGVLHGPQLPVSLKFYCTPA